MIYIRNELEIDFVRLRPFGLSTNCVKVVHSLPQYNVVHEQNIVKDVHRERFLRSDYDVPTEPVA